MLGLRRIALGKANSIHNCSRITPAMSYSAAASQGGKNNEPSSTHTSSDSDRTHRQPRVNNGQTNGAAERPQKRYPSPAHVPVTEKEGESVYVLTLLTDVAHHKRMTALRERFFPKHLNKLGAHLTLFHALPGSRLDDHILPTIQDVVAHTASFKVHAVKPFRLKRGMAISVAKNHGSVQAQELHDALQKPWLDAGFLSEQDRGACRIHYTVMNKVEDDAKVAKALSELENEFRGDWGVAEGLGLWRYHKGYWNWEKRFDFKKTVQES